MTADHVEAVGADTLALALIDSMRDPGKLRARVGTGVCKFVIGTGVAASQDR